VLPQDYVVVPAVDVLGDEAVRLEQGDFARVTLRAGGPLELVRRYVAAGARLVHLVDLEAARTGGVRPELVATAVEAAAGTPVQAAGGVRSVADAEALLAAGAARVVVGTAAFAGDALPRFTEALGARLVVAIDVRDDAVAVAGWTRSAGVSAEEAADRCAAAGVHRVLCTAVERDGTGAGPDLDLLARVRDRFGGPVLAAGGITTVADLDALAAIGVEGAVVGTALIDGRLPLSTLAA
jgi:phosphoribosylformimino-5-aminoimidazole carboxamide ribotide isomerase